MAASTESTKNLCFLCNKAKGIYKCEGCSQVFCPKHCIDHRNELNKQLEEITVAHDVVHQALNQQVEDPQKHFLLKQIDQWELSAIEKIRQTAEKVRNELFEGITQLTTQMKQNLQILSNQLKHGGQENDFSEIDLLQWKQKLEELQKEILNPTAISIQEDSTSLFNNIYVIRREALDVFESSCGNAEIRENGRLVVKALTNEYAEVRGKNAYSTGRHTIRFRVERSGTNCWIAFGIIPQSQSVQSDSWRLPSNNGWSTTNQTYANGQAHDSNAIDIIENDVVVLLINCDQRKIELKNERTNHTVKMSVNTSFCPFPWQYHLNFYTLNTSVRILPIDA